MSVFGELKDAGRVEEAFIERLRLWMPTYLSEVERQRGLTPGDIAIPRAVFARNDFDRWQENQTPFIMVVASGTGATRRSGDGYYSGDFLVGVGTFISSRDEATTRRLAHLYGAAVRGCIVQRRSLNDMVEVADWTGADSDQIDVENTRSVQIFTESFSATLRKIVSWKEGPPPSWPTDTPIPAEPPDDPTLPWPDRPIAENVNIEVERET